MNTLASVKSHLTHHLPLALQSYQSVINFLYTSFWLISLVTYSLAVLYFVLFEAETFVEYAESAFYCSVTFLHVVSYVILVQTRSKLFGLLKDSDAMVQERKMKMKYHSKFVFPISNLNLQLFVICFPFPQGVRIQWFGSFTFKKTIKQRHYQNRCWILHLYLPKCFYFQTLFGLSSNITQPIWAKIRLICYIHQSETIFSPL